MNGAGSSAAFSAVVGRARELWAGYEPPDFGHVPDPDAAIFLSAIDHRTGYRESHRVEGQGPFSGSELMWTLGLRAAARRPGLLRAQTLSTIEADELAEIFAIDGETVADPHVRAELWRDLAGGLERDYGGEAAQLLRAARGRLGGSDGLLARLSSFRAYGDPLAKKAQLYAKICERRGWWEVADPECWEVSADNVLMRLALRSGLVASGELDEVRSATRAAFRQVAVAVGISPPLLDDLLWELGRDDPDLLGVSVDVREPERDPGSSWY